ncbi:MAG TPA: hypothetical protein DDW50_06940 [Firmicutes bacterium]|nr:hypothetical protein [Bacillota bacterium]
MGSVAAFWLLFGRSKSDSAGESRGHKGSTFIDSKLPSHSHYFSSPKSLPVLGSPQQYPF